MRLSVDNGTVTCSLDNKNSDFLWACRGLFDGFLNGKLKMYWDNPEEWQVPEAATGCNARRLEEILRNARKYGVEITESVAELNDTLQALVSEIKARRLAEQEYKKQCEHWERLCKNGCGKCRNLAYDVDQPICKQTGEILDDRIVPTNTVEYYALFNLVAFPSEDCPFNINKKTRSKV